MECLRTRLTSQIKIGLRIFSQFDLSALIKDLSNENAQAQATQNRRTFAYIWIFDFLNFRIQMDFCLGKQNHHATYQFVVFYKVRIS